MGENIKTIYYSSELQSLNDEMQPYFQAEKIVLNLEQIKEIKFYRLEKPEIYKHTTAFRFLENFTSKSLHLIIRKPENIRLLKGAYNVLIAPCIITENEFNRTDSKPFLNYQRMLSIVHEIWTNRKENFEVLNKFLSIKTRYFNDEKDLINYIELSI